MKLFTLTLNTWLLPLNISKDNEKRLSKIVEYIKSNDFDIVLLQEVWLGSYVNYLKKLVGSRYKVYTSGQSKYFNRTGLVTLVRKNIKVLSFSSSIFQQNYKFNIAERIARKGFHTLHLETDLKFTLINLHLYASTQRAIQSSQLKNVLESRPDTNLVIGGDFNLTWEEISMNFNIFRDPISLDFTISKSNPYQNMGFNKKSQNEFKIDHILISKKSRFKIQNEVIVKEILSDHYAISCTIS